LEVATLLRYQRIVVALLNDFPLLHQADVIHILQLDESVRNEHYGLISKVLVE
jgi:hypothetical protein